MSNELRVYSLLDSKTNLFMNLELYYNDLEAERGIITSIKRNPQSILCQFPDDFKLYRLGIFDTEKGIESVEDKPVFVCSLKDLFTPSPSGSEDINIPDVVPVSLSK